LGFGPTLQYDVIEALKGYEAKKPKGWIFDLRTNASGDYGAMQGMLGKLLKDGPFGYDQDQQGRRTALGPAGGYLARQHPYAVLVSDSTSSAAELFASAIEYHKGGTVIGSKTAGCAGMSARVPLSDGSLLSLTVRRVLAPGGVELTRSGFSPKELVEVSRADLAAGKDPQLDRALAVLGAR
jgi:carboxyl-terminal processing protease